MLIRGRLGSYMLLEIEDLRKSYETGIFGMRRVNAVDGVSFNISEGEIFGLIGESGCGKTTLTKMILGLMHPSGGSIKFDGREISRLKSKEWRGLRKDIQAIFQHPQMTFNPKRSIYSACLEPVRLHNLDRRMDAGHMVRHMAQRVGISEDQLYKYPHEISGGQAQRISIARALSLNPRLLVCDEPTSMLDVSVQAQILSLIREANVKYGVSMLFISHDLEVIQSMCSSVAVMKQGRIIETGDVDKVFREPEHEYTRKLMNSYISI